MSFLNGLLLLGGLAFIVPLIIHLLNRSKFQTVEWGAMHLLESIELQNSKRIQWQAWLLLLLRCLIPVILALCMARPIWNWWMSSASGGAATTVLVIDDSFSMQAKVRDGGSGGDDGASKGANDATGGSFEPNRQGAGELLQPNRQRAGELLQSNRHRAGELRQPSRQGAGEVQRAFDHAVEQAKQIAGGVGTRSAKSVITTGGAATAVTDGTSYDPRPIERQLERLQANAVGSDPAAALQLAIATAAKTQDPYRQILVWSDFQKHDWESIPGSTWDSLREQIRDLTVPASLHFFPQPLGPAANVSLWIDSDTTELALVGEPLEVRTVIANRGSANLMGLPLRVLLNEREVATKRIDLAPYAEMQASFLVAIEEAGSHVIQVAIDDPSGMQGDDVDEMAVEAVSPIQVLLVESRNDLPLLQLETGFLQVTWQATARDDGRHHGVVIERVTSDRLQPGMLSGKDMVVLANVSRVNDAVAQALHEQVKAGLSLMVFGGDQVDRDWYEQRWGANATERLLPFRYGVPIDAQQAKAANNSSDTSNSINSAMTTSRLLKGPPYNEPALTLFNNPQQGRLDQVSVKRWHRFANNENSATSSANTLSTLPAGATPLLTLVDDTPVLVKFPVGQGVVYQWSIRANDAWSDLPIRPVYLPLMQRLLLFAKHSTNPRDVSAIKLESQSVPMSQPELATLAERLGATVHSSASEFLTGDSQRRSGWEIWRWVLLGVLAVLFGELFIEKRITRGAA